MISAQRDLILFYMSNTATQLRFRTTILPMDLISGERLHVRADGVLSTVAGVRWNRGATVIISFTDHPEICVCGGTEVCVFSPLPNG